MSLCPVRRTQGAYGHWVFEPATFLAGIPAVTVGPSGREAPSSGARGLRVPELVPEPGWEPHRTGPRFLLPGGRTLSVVVG